MTMNDFKNEVMQKLDTSKSNNPPKTIKYYLNKLIENLQILNSVQKNNLKAQGNAKQNNLFNVRIQQTISAMKDYIEFIGSGLSVVEVSKSGLYKLCINNQLLDIPERKVEIMSEKTEDGIELMPQIVD